MTGGARGASRTVAPRVKICCIGSIHEAAVAIAHGASALGLVSHMPSGPGVVGEARIGVGRETAWWVERAYGGAGRVEDGVFTTGYSSLGQLATWVLRQDGRAIPLEPPALRE